MKPVHDSKPPDPDRIVIFMPTWVGDVVMSTPALGAIRERFPDAQITLLIKSNTRAVLDGGRWMDDVIAWPATDSKISKWMLPLVMGRCLRDKRFDLAVLLSNSFRSALTARLGRIARRVGYDRDGRGFLLTDRILPKRVGREYEKISTVDYYNDLVEAIDCERPSQQMELVAEAQDISAVEARLAGWGVGDRHPLVVINPGASFGPSKLWPPERYATVADALVRGRNAVIVIAFGPGELHLAEVVRDGMSSPAYLVNDPPGTLGQLKALIKRCDLLLNNDTGPRHFAKAFGRRVVTVFGSTHVEWTHTDYPLEKSVRIDVDCGPCQKKVCPLGHHKCMTGVTGDMVYDAAIELLDRDDATNQLENTS